MIQHNFEKVPDGSFSGRLRADDPPPKLPPPRTNEEILSGVRDQVPDCRFRREGE